MVIVAALAAKAAGVGYRRIAMSLGRPAETVRGWLRRFAARAEAVRGVFTVLLRALAADPVMPAGRGCVGGRGGRDRGGGAWRRRPGSRCSWCRCGSSLWRSPVGRLLAPGWPDRR